MDDGAMTADHFHCGEPLRLEVAANLGRFKVRGRQGGAGRRAAVAITIVETAHGPGVYGLPRCQAWSPAAALILTQRAAGLRNHAGQWAFPGGRMEDGEQAETTALRELSEEVGLPLTEDRILGRLDDYATRSGFSITPVVVWGGTDVTLTANPDEVAAVHRIPIAEFMRDDAPILENIPESRHPVLLMPVGNSWIAAPTAAMLYQFREVAIRGNDTRVAHFEQPYFAWQ
jgi:8-oxo-dGTP pyrophosphatase MutT (NUDIX family)